MQRKFPLGQVVTTPALIEKIHPDDVVAALNRHVQGDWGDVDEHDRKENELSLIEGLRLFSVYHDRHSVKFWIITEADRSSTCILLPEDY